MMLGSPSPLLAMADGAPPVVGPVGPVDPATLFAGGEKGGYWLFKDLAAARVARDGSGAAPAVGDPIGFVPDQSPNALHLSCDNDSIRPLAQASGAMFDGLDDGLFNIFGFSIPTPFTLMLRLNQVSYVHLARIASSLSAGVQLLQHPSSGHIDVASSSDGPDVPATIGAFFVVECLMNGGLTEARLDNGPAIAVGTSSVALDSLILGRSFGGAPSNVLIAEALLIGRALTGGERAGVFQWMSA